MSIAGMHDKTVDEDEDFDSIAPDRGWMKGRCGRGTACLENVEKRKEQR